MINDAQSLYGFIAGLLASNHDITDLFVDATFRICNRDLAAFDNFLTEVDKLTAKFDVNLVMTYQCQLRMLLRISRNTYKNLL
jgi:hypothetical protein